MDHICLLMPVWRVFRHRRDLSAKTCLHKMCMRSLQTRSPYNCERLESLSVHDFTDFLEYPKFSVPGPSIKILISSAFNDFKHSRFNGDFRVCEDLVLALIRHLTTQKTPSVTSSSEPLCLTAGFFKARAAHSKLFPCMKMSRIGCMIAWIPNSMVPP